MDEFLNNIRQNPAMLYFLVIFSVLWGGGMLWGIIVVIKSVGKRRTSLRALRSMGFEKAANRPELIRKIEPLCLQTLGRFFSKRVEPNPRKELFQVSSNNKKLFLVYNIPKNEYRSLPRATGVREIIQITGRKLTLSRILFRSAGREAFYAETNDTETIRAYKPRKRTKSIIGWVLCFSADEKFNTSIVIHRKFTGHRKFLMNLALNIAKVRPVVPKDILPEFSDAFEVNLPEPLGSKPVLGKQLQQIILAYKDFMPQGTKLFINQKGIWFTGEEWPARRQMEQMLKLGEELSGQKAYPHKLKA